MITSGRRGYQYGSELACAFPSLLPEIVVRVLAQRTHAALRSAGYAHIDPEEDFVEHFCAGFVLHFALCLSS